MRVSSAKRIRGSLLPLITTAALIGAWQLSGSLGLLPPEISSPVQIAEWLIQYLQTAAFWTALGQTLWHWAAGLGIALVAGVVVGVAIGGIPALRAALTPTMELLRPIPPVVYLPVVVLAWGGTSQTAIVLVAVGAFWPIVFQTTYGLAAIDPTLKDTARVFGLRPRQRLLSITFPSVLPYLATGIRIALSLALILAVAMELIGGVAGLGSNLAVFAANGVHAGLYGLVIVTGTLGILTNWGMARVEHRLLHWHVAHREVSL